MAMAMKSGGISRFTDFYDEPIDHLLSPIKGYQDQKLVSLNEAIQPISQFFNEIEDNVFVALHNCQNPSDTLTQEESASIHLYTMQFHGGPSLYLLFNQSLRTENREELKPWFPFLKLFLTALYKLPSCSKTVWRGIKNVDLSSKYKKGIKFAWWSVSSCTTDIEVLESNAFLGKTGLRTIFSIECINGKSIINHSYFKNIEKEIILMPGSYFEVIGQLNPAPELHIIQVQEITPPITLVKPPFNKSNSYVQSTLTMTKPDTSSNMISKTISLKSNTKWKQQGITVAGGNGEGNQLNQLRGPYAIYIDDDRTIYVADNWNHRIVKWKYNATSGQIVAGGNGLGNQTNQLNEPTDVIIDKETNSLIITDWANKRVIRWSLEANSTNGQIIVSNINCSRLAIDKEGSLYISDYMKNEVNRWKSGVQNRKLVAGGNGKGDRPNQLNWPAFIFVDEKYSLYISDYHNHRVMKWLKDAKEGFVVAGGNGQGNSLTQLNHPQGVVVDQLGQIYVADSGNNRVMCWNRDATEGTIVVGENQEREQSNQLNSPIGLSFDRQGNLYVVDRNNHRIQKFEIN